MNRLDRLRKHVDPQALGLEIAPYFNAIARKSDGYRVLILDVVGTDGLRQMAQQDPLIANERVNEIEPVDFVADACDLIDVVEANALSGKLSYIVSSHNFEHLPNPIRFLQGCSAALKPGGTLTMAIPDYRACFDHFRMPTRLSDWLAAYHRGYRSPQPESLFDYLTCNAHPSEDGSERFVPIRLVRFAYSDYLADLAGNAGYKDTHCSTLFGESFELLVRDLRHLGLVDLDIVDVSPTQGFEFFATLRKPFDGTDEPESEDAYYRRRERLLRDVNRQLGSAGLHLIQGGQNSFHEANRSVKRVIRRITGARIYALLAAINAARRRAFS